jgi:hypothetical protein
MSVTQIAVESVDFFVRNVSMRLPFRYGTACLTSSPILHTRLRARGEDGTSVTGVCADLLAPKWFDKSPDKNYRNNIEDLVAVAKMGARHYSDAGAELRSAFALWHDAYLRTTDDAQAAGYNGLTASFGSSIIERAVLDAAGKLAGADYHTMVYENRLGIDPEQIHPELAGRRMDQAVAPQPLDKLYIRHTVGLGDPIFDADVPEDERIDDGIPQSLEAWLRAAKIRYFKIKVCADLEADMARLKHMASLLEKAAPANYQVSLDGNEQFKSGQALKSWLEAVCEDPALKQFLQRVIFIEQPMDRAVALTEEGAKGFLGIEGLPPVAIDESDDSIDAFKQSAGMGYRGTSVKNCKGVFKGLFNKMLLDMYNEEDQAGFVLTGEDLCNQPIVPLQQDLCTLSVLGIPHAERNGQHYGGTLGHVSKSEVDETLRVHSNLYEPFGGSAKLRITDGAFDLTSLRQVGYGLGIETDFDNMTPVDDWQYESLGFED